MKKTLFFCFFLISLGCMNIDEKENTKIDPITRKGNEKKFTLFVPEKKHRNPYPWEEGVIENFPKITKEFFRCKGHPMNPAVSEIDDQKNVRNFADCEGSTKHSLSLVHGKEGVYPILIELLNYIQMKTKKRVIITCGYRCPVHNLYADRSKRNRISKHMIGAEVDFYVQEMENKPMQIVDLIFQYYRENSKYQNDPSYYFSRYEKETDVSIQPWMNKEVFIKLYQKNEGRDFDNMHSYPYLSIQVRYDYELDERVTYSWDKACSGYMRW